MIQFYYKNFDVMSNNAKVKRIFCVGPLRRVLRLSCRVIVASPPSSDIPYNKWRSNMQTEDDKKIVDTRGRKFCLVTANSNNTFHAPCAIICVKVVRALAKECSWIRFWAITSGRNELLSGCAINMHWESVRAAPDWWSQNWTSCARV